MSSEDQSSQEAAAAAWRAARAQKSCLHSDKPDEKKVKPSKTLNDIDTWGLSIRKAVYPHIYQECLTEEGLPIAKLFRDNMADKHASIQVNNVQVDNMSLPGQRQPLYFDECMSLTIV
jgi:hypothetical protein